MGHGGQCQAVNIPRADAGASLSPLSAILRTLVSAGELCGTAVSLSRPCSP